MRLFLFSNILTFNILNDTLSILPKCVFINTVSGFV